MSSTKLASFSNTKLKEICRTNKIPGFSDKSKDELITLITSHFVKDNETTPLKYIDLFCGIGGFHQALSAIGAKCVLASDIDKKCCESYKLNYGIEPVNDIKNIDEKTMVDFDIICGGFPCFVAGTKVLTNAGYKYIEDVNLDDTLMTHTGKFQNILNLQQKNYTGMLYNIKIKNHPSFIRCTEEHPFYVREKTRKWNSELLKYEYTFINPEWKKAVDLTTNDYFGMKINENSIIPEFTFNNKNTTEAIDMILEDSDMWFMMGYFVGDGWIEETIKNDGRSMNKIRFAINSKDNEYVVDRINKILKITDIKCPSGDKRDNYECDNYEWFNILQHFGKCAESKVIPEWVQDAPKEYIQEFINGYQKADVCVNDKECYSFTTVSYNLAFGLQRLYLKLGHIFSIKKFIRPKTTVIEGITVNQRDTYQIEGYVKDDKRKQSSFIENGYVWCAPFKMETECVENEPVYNFEVHNDNSYIVENTIVHNCQPFSNGGNKKSFKDKRGLLFDEIMRMAKHKTPKFMFLENVKHILKVSDGAVFEYIKQQIKGHGYELQIFQMSPHRYGIPQQRERVFFVCVRKDIYNGKDIELIEEDKGLTAEDIVEDDPDPKYNISDDVRNVLDAWDELIKQFEVGEKLSPTIMMHDAYKKYTDVEFNALPSWRRDYITRNKPLFIKYKKIIDPWYKKYKEILSKREIYGQLEWQTGPVSENESIYNHFIQLRQSGLRIKKSEYFPTLVAITQTPIYGKYKRHITPRECARLQSFPETFKLDSIDRVTYKQMGNSVNVFNVSTVVKSTLQHYNYI
jgi:DNA (cytosine-5)-methyltransferase 1